MAADSLDDRPTHSTRASKRTNATNTAYKQLAARESREPGDDGRKKRHSEESDPANSKQSPESNSSNKKISSQRLEALVAQLRNIKSAKEAAAIILEISLRIKQHELVVDGADHAVISAMKRYSNYCKIQTRGCKALKEMACKGLPSIESIIDMGGSDIVLVAMEKHRAEEDLQKEACKAIKCLTENNNPGKQSFGSDAKDAIKALIHAVNDHPSSATLQCLVCKALSAIAEDEEKCSLAIVNRGGLDAIRQTLKNHDDSTEVLEAAFQTLINISSATEKQELDEEIAMTISLDRVLATMLLYRTNKAIQGQGMCLLCKLCKLSGRNRAKLATLYGLEVVTRSLDICLDNKEVQKHGTMLLQYLSQTEGNAVAAGLVSEGGMDLLLDVLSMHGSDPLIVQQISLTIARLSRPFADRIRKEGGIALIMKGMRRHDDSASVQEAACFALWKLAQKEENAVSINSNGGVSLINAALKRFPEDRSLREVACEALAELSHDEQYKMAQKTLNERQQNIPAVPEDGFHSNWPCVGCL